MILDILINTPFYIYWMFFSLIAVGYMQSKTRRLGIRRALIMPVLLCFLSFLGFLLDFGLTFLSSFFYFIGLCLGLYLALFLNQKYSLSKQIQYSSLKRSFVIQGSFIPLTMMMFVFFIKYFVGVVSAINLERLKEEEFIMLFSLLYGLFSALFFMRFYVLYQKSKV